MTKEQARAVIEQMPEEFTVDEMVQRLIIIEDIEKARQSFENGDFKTHEEVKALAKTWGR